MRTMVNAMKLRAKVNSSIVFYSRCTASMTRSFHSDEIHQIRPNENCLVSVDFLNVFAQT